MSENTYGIVAMTLLLGDSLCTIEGAAWYHNVFHCHNYYVYNRKGERFHFSFSANKETNYKF